MTPESRNSLSLGNGSVNTFPRKRTRANSTRAMFPVVRAALAVTQLCGKHISAAVSQHETIVEAVFFVRAALRLCNEDIRHLELALRKSRIWQLAE
jgi:hypothetical protein